MRNAQLLHEQVGWQATTFPIALLAHDMAVPMNVGSLFRLADALGVERLFLTGTSPTPPNSKIRKTARSTEKQVPYEYHRDPVTVVERLSGEGYRIISLEITANSRDIRQLARDLKRVCLIVGAENTGIDQALLDRSDEVIHIPMFGHNSSMNVATACAIALFEIGRRFMPLP